MRPVEDAQHTPTPREPNQRRRSLDLGTLDLPPSARSSTIVEIGGLEFSQARKGGHVVKRDDVIVERQHLLFAQLAQHTIQVNVRNAQRFSEILLRKG